jgi:RNAse (barnase) inhibitor barstar
MSFFNNKQEYWQRLDFNILKNGAIHLYHRPEILAADIAWFKENNYRIFSFDCAAWLTIDKFRDDMTRNLNLEFYGNNLDAFNDCLCGLDIPEDSGFILQFLRYDLFAKRLPKAAQVILDIIEVNSRRYLLMDQRLIALVQSNDPAIQFETVGACSVSWNRKEWFRKSRGL